MSEHIIGMFRTRSGAEGAVNSLVAAGFKPTDVSMLVTDKTRGEHFEVERHTQAPEGAAVGGAAGGAIGAIAAGLTAVASLAIPGIGFLAAGPIVAALAGGGAGAAAGGIIGALIGLGVPRHEAHLYDEELRGGGMLVGVRAISREQEHVARQVLRESGALTQLKS